MNNRRVRITLISQAGTCPRGHQIGDTWTTDGAAPEGIYLGALNTLIPSITTLRFGEKFPWMEKPGEVIFACPDHLVRNVFKVERITS